MSRHYEPKDFVILSERDYLGPNAHVSYATTRAFEDACVCQGAKLLALSSRWRFANRILGKLHLRDFGYPKVTEQDGQCFLFVAMGIGNLRMAETLLRSLSKSHPVAIYMFDVWEPDFAEWERLLNRINASHLYFAYKAAADHFARLRDGVHFLPQSMNEAVFHPHDCKKTRLFMQMGRRIEVFHKAVLHYMSAHEIPACDENYIYEKERGQIIYPKFEELSENISKTKFFICAPRSFEETAAAGSCSDVTARFYEAMACKTLIVGIKPDTFDLLFPSDAMIALAPDGSDFDEKIDYLLSNPTVYMDLIESNYRNVMANHRWTNRFNSIVDTINGQ